MSNRKNYTVLIAFPKGGGHWAKKGETLELLDVEAQALRRAGRIALTATLEPEATTAKKATAKE